MYNPQWVVDDTFENGTAWDLVNEHGEINGSVQNFRGKIISTTYGLVEPFANTTPLVATGWTSLQEAARDVMRNLALPVVYRDVPFFNPAPKQTGWLF